jgi:pilus assembly protein Flp/PilA
MHKLLAFIVAFQSKALDEKEKGATATEYALLVALIALVIFAAVTFFGTQLSTFFQTLGSTVSGWI